MLKNIKSYWSYGTTFCSIKVTSLNGEDAFYTVTAKKKKNEFEDFEFIKSISFEKLSKRITKHQHCYLTINTDKVLIKEISLEKDNHKAVSNAFPSLSLNEFYYEILNTGNKSIVAICRRNYVDQLVSEAELQKIEVLGFHLGFSCINKIAPLLKEEEIVTSRFRLNSLGNEIDSFIQEDNTSSKNYIVEDVQITSGYILPLSGMLSYISKGEGDNNFKDLVNNLKTRQEQKNLFRKGFVVGIGILLFSLLLNFFFFNSYYKELQSKQEEVQLLESQKETILAKTQELELKEKIVENVLNSTQSKSSFYINRITSELPSSILFSNIEYQPLEKAIRPDKEIEYKKDAINVSGESNDEPSFTIWIESLEKLEWTKKVTITHYGYSKNNNSEFSINIQF